jgi:hypothetical protein
VSVFDRSARRRAPTDELGPSASQRLARVETQVTWARRGLAALVTLGLGSAGAYYRSWQTATEQRGVDRFRLERVERDLEALRAGLIGWLPFLRNPPAPPADGDEP